MKSLSKESEIIALAQRLNLGRGDPVKNILNYCLERVRAVIAKRGPATTIEEVEHVLCEELNLYIREVNSEEGLSQLVEAHLEVGDLGFALLSQYFDEHTFGTLMRCTAANPSLPEPLVAVVDCRGEKRNRRFFTKWHEIAEALIMDGRQRANASVVGHRAVERMIDTIAGEIGFLPELFLPILQEELDRTGGFTFEGVDRVRKLYCEHASYEATLWACVKQAPLPVVLIVAGMGLKKSEQEEMESGQVRLFPNELPVEKLRVKAIFANDRATKRGLRVHKNMRVPDSCVISTVFHCSNVSDYASFSAIENLNAWETSTGKRLADIEVTIQSIRVRNKAYGLITVGPHADEERRTVKRRDSGHAISA
jgi:hypothetical protein